MYIYHIIMDIIVFSFNHMYTCVVNFLLWIKLIITNVDTNTKSLSNIFQLSILCPLSLYNIVVHCWQGDKPIPQERLDRIAELIEPWFIFALTWSMGATGDNDSWVKFSKWLREAMKKEGVGVRDICWIENFINFRKAYCRPNILLKQILRFISFWKCLSRIGFSAP